MILAYILSLDPPRNTTVSVRPAGGPKYGVPATLTCSSDANPPVHTYIWYQGDACVPTADMSFYKGRQTSAALTGRGLTLSSANITTEEQEQTCCVARNKHGSQIFSVMFQDSRGTETNLYS